MERATGPVSASSWTFIAPFAKFNWYSGNWIALRRDLFAIDHNPEETRQLTAVLQEHLGYPFQITFQHMHEIQRKANFKYEDFISEIPGVNALFDILVAS